MKISVLIPSEEYLQQAGARIRYQRIEAHLRALGHELTAHPIDEFTSPGVFVDDVYLISKIHDARSLIAADIAREAGKLVGVDLFDDYYSQHENPRLARMRLWLHILKPKLDFLLCSTPEMRDLGLHLLPGVPAHVMNDPAPAIDMGHLSDLLAHKLKTAHETRQIKLLWFGMGDNPHFSVGLSDLVAWGPELVRLGGKGFEVRLHILTNRRALTADTLAMLRQLPLEARIEEWTEVRESELLAESLACFLPVNAQNFSIVKSLNRAATALSSGTQILSAGYPLYAAMGTFIYREPLKLLADLDAQQPLLRVETLGQLSELFGQWADAEQEASSFAAFLGGLAQRAPVPRPLFTAVIHGINSPPFAHKFAQRARALSVASPFYKGKLNLDVKFEFAAKGDSLVVLVSEKRLAALAPEHKKLVSLHGKVVDATMYILDVKALGITNLPAFPTALTRAPLASALIYSEVMLAIQQVLACLFPGITCIVSEMEANTMDVEMALSQGVA